MSDNSTSAATDEPQAKVVIERTYRAQIEELWELWTTKAGFESWWGPRAFASMSTPSMRARAVRSIRHDRGRARPIAAMKQMGQPLSTARAGGSPSSGRSSG